MNKSLKKAIVTLGLCLSVVAGGASIAKAASFSLTPPGAGINVIQEL